ncbi:hypothetical protein VPH35_092128 [Triticum aestivum]
MLLLTPHRCVFPVCSNGTGYRRSTIGFACVQWLCTVQVVTIVRHRCKSALDASARVARGLEFVANYDVLGYVCTALQLMMRARIGAFFSLKYSITLSPEF